MQEYAVDAQGQSSLTKQLIRGTGMGGGIGSVLYSETVSSGSVTNTEYFAYNAVGSVVALLNGSGTVTSTSDFEAFGSEVRNSGSTTETRKFCTKERDSSIGLDNFGFRYYDAELGRFVQRDPSGYPDGPNNYLYCHNNPINGIDPLGLRDMTKEEQKTWDKANEKALNEYSTEGKAYVAALNRGNVTAAEQGQYSKAMKLYIGRKKALGELKMEVDKIKEKGDMGYDADTAKLKNKRVGVAYNALDKWTDDANAKQYKYEEKAPAILGGPSKSGKNTYKCNRFVADCFGEEVGWDVSSKKRSEKTGREGFPLQKDSSGTWPARANSNAQKGENIRSFTNAKDIRGGNLRATQKSGDIVAFPNPGGIGHTAIAVGHSGIVEATADSKNGVNFRPTADKYPNSPARVRTYTGSGK